MTPASLMNTYGTRTTTLTHGDGVFVWDSEGRRYLDAVSGIAVCGLGHNHPRVTEAICEQAKTLLHCSNLYLIEPQMALGAALVAASGMDKVFFSNSGAEANEAALKIARKYGNDKGIEAPEVITTNNSFHGRTMATLSATGNPKIKAGFAPYLSGFTHAEFNNIEAIIEASTPNTVAVMLEPVQGEGGINVPSSGYLTALRRLCDEKGWLLILDEIQTGNGRTGTYFAYQHYGIKPDVVTTAKGLGNGVPIGACLTLGHASEILQPGNHGSTFGGNPLATRASLAVVQELTQPGFLEKVSETSLYLLTMLREALSQETGVKDVRGQGMMIGIELAYPCAELVEKAKEEGLLINVTAGNTIRLLPPLIITRENADEITTTIAKITHAFLSSQN